MTQLRKRVLEELERRNYSQATARSYLGAIRRFAEHFGRSPDQLGPEQVRQYQLYLLRERKLTPRSLSMQMAAIRFLYLKTLKRVYRQEDLPLPKVPQRLPVVLSREEIARLIAAASNLRHRTILMTLYSTGMRRSELCHLRLEDVDSQCMLIRIRQGKGAKDRNVPLSPKLLEQMRLYWRSLKHKPTVWLFPSIQGKRAGQPIESKTVWNLCHEAARRAGLAKAVHPHTLRHSFATHLLEAGADLRTIQVLLGHTELRHTIVYIHLSARHLFTVANPLDTLELPVAAPEAGPPQP